RSEAKRPCGKSLVECGHRTLLARFVSAAFRWRVASSCPLFQRRHINHEAIFDVAFQEAVVSLVYVLNLNHFDVGGDSVLGAKIQHLLCFANAADNGTRKPPPSSEQAKGRDGNGIFWSANQNQCAVKLDEGKISIQIMIGGDCIKNKIEAGRMLLHFRRRS